MENDETLKRLGSVGEGSSGYLTYALKRLEGEWLSHVFLSAVFLDKGQKPWGLRPKLPKPQGKPTFFLCESTYHMRLWWQWNSLIGRQSLIGLLMLPMF